MYHWTRVLALYWLLAQSAVVAAADAALSLNQAVARVLDGNPQLQAADFDTHAAAQRIRQQRLGTSYELGLQLENFAGSGAASGSDELETTLSLSRVLELGGKPARRGEVARLEAGLLRHDQDAQRLELLAETARRFLALARAQAEQELARERLALHERTLRAVERRQAFGKATAAERARAGIELARAELDLEEYTHRLDTGRRRLAVLWGGFDADFSHVAADLTRLDPEPDFAALDGALDANPAIARLATAERLAAARALLVRSRGRPDPQLGAGLRHFNASGDVGLVLSLRMPLGSAGRAAPYADEAAALAAREPLLAQDRRLAVRVTLYDLHQELLHARERFETYRDRIVPTAAAAQQAYAEGYAAGRHSLLELNAAQSGLLEARREQLAAATDHHAARIEIDRLVGVAPANGVSP